MNVEGSSQNVWVPGEIKAKRAQTDNSAPKSNMPLPGSSNAASAPVKVPNRSPTQTKATARSLTNSLKTVFGGKSPVAREPTPTATTTSSAPTAWKKHEWTGEWQEIPVSKRKDTQSAAEKPAKETSSPSFTIGQRRQPAPDVADDDNSTDLQVPEQGSIFDSEGFDEEDVVKEMSAKLDALKASKEYKLAKIAIEHNREISEPSEADLKIYRQVQELEQRLNKFK